MSAVPIAIVGGGIAGLSAAYELAAREVQFRLLEASRRLGGVIRTERVDPFVVDAGPDSFLVQKPAALALCHELGLGDRLIATRPPRRAFVLRDGRLYPLPEPSLLGVPTRLGALVHSQLLSPLGRLRVACDVLIPPPPAPPADESLASFFGRRFGSEALAYIGEPLLAGIHAGDADRLSMHALFPRLVDAERRHGSVIRALRRTRVDPGPDGAFRSLTGGMQELPDALARRLPPDAIRLGAAVRRIDGHGPFSIECGDGTLVHARAVILAVPAFVAADLLGPLDAEIARLCREIPYTSTATVVLAYRRDVVGSPLNGAGFVVPRVERGVKILASTWISAKWPERAPDDWALVRGFVGGARDPGALEHEDNELTRIVHADLARILSIAAEPTLSRVYRWEQANPQHEVGHARRLAAIEDRLAQRPGLFLTGSAYRGVGIPECIADGRATAARAAMLTSAYAAYPAFPIQ